MREDQRQAWVNAYLVERAGAERAKQAERVALIDAELAALGHVPPVEASAPPRRTAAAERPKGRPRA